MNKQEVIKALESAAYNSGTFFKVMEVSLKKAKEIVEQIDEPKKPVVSQVAVDYYEQYKDRLTGFDEWFADFYESSFVEDFPKAEELQEWLYDNDEETNNQRELALATLIVNGIDAVEVEQEKKYIVKFKNLPKSHCYLNYSEEYDEWSFATVLELDTVFTSHTKSELEQAGFGEVFESSMFEVEEVTA